MALDHLTPIIILATANDYQDGKRTRLLVKEKKMIHDIFQAESAQTLYYIVDEDPEKGGFIFDIFRQHYFSPDVSILHISGFSMGETLHFRGGFGEEILTPKEFANQVAKFPNLKLIFLNGCATPQVLDELLAKDIPAVITTQVDFNRKKASDFTHTFYTGIARGLSINQAIERLAEKFPAYFQKNRVTYQLESDDFTWEGKEKSNNLAWGAYLLEGKETEREWKLPVRLPAEETIPDEPKKKGRGFMRISLIVILLATILGSGYWMGFPQKLVPKREHPDTCLFNNAGTYNILLLPLHEQANCEASDEFYLRAVWRRLIKLKNDGEGFDIQQLKDANCPASFEEAESMIRSCNANLVLWGDYTIPTNDAVSFNFQYLYTSKANTVKQGNLPLDMQMFLFSEESDLMASAVEDVVYWARGNSHFDRQEYKEATIFFEKMRVRDNPQLKFVDLKLAECYKQLGDYHMAKDHYDQALSLAPEDFEIFNERGLIYLQLKDYENALIDFKDATRINPQYAEAYFNLGVLYLNIDQFAKAVENVEKGQQIQPQGNRRYGVLAAIYAAQREEELFYSNFELALQNGADVETIMNYSAALKEYRNQPAFQKLIEKYQKK
ncbi:MAG: tetratricopeptide repeat protein [Bacteroidetes bacterium]|nr:tetratricopeptide repeat protein [Bacteroidota bacterium]MCB0841646.1 tetratricopeptide repeat protein [Bacteroidota bacterium]